MCKYQYEYEGYRSFGDNIPGYAQGAYFPGDEPGMRCKLTGEACGNISGDTPENCPTMEEETEWLCPKCQEEDEYDVRLWLSKGGKEYFCPICKSEWTADELPRAYIKLFTTFREAFDELFEYRQYEKDKNERLRKKLEVIRGAVEDIE